MGKSTGVLFEADAHIRCDRLVGIWAFFVFVLKCKLLDPMRVVGPCGLEPQTSCVSSKTLWPTELRVYTDWGDIVTAGDYPKSPNHS
jgi:hypothetical protein